MGVTMSTVTKIPIPIGYASPHQGFLKSTCNETCLSTCSGSQLSFYPVSSLFCVYNFDQLNVNIRVNKYDLMHFGLHGPQFNDSI